MGCKSPGVKFLVLEEMQSPNQTQNEKKTEIFACFRFGIYFWVHCATKKWHAHRKCLTPISSRI